jgi:acyl-CoA thioesterase-1
MFEEIRLMKKIFFFGDSICVGQYVSIHKGWVTRVSHELQDKAIVINSSVSGRTTRQALEDMPYHIQEQRPDILVVQFGMNDCNYWKSDRGAPRVSPGAFKANMEEIITRALAFDVDKILLNTNHVTGLTDKVIPYTKITYQESNEFYNTIVRDAASNFEDVALCDVEKEFKKYDNVDVFLLPDLLHPNEVGHTLYFNTVYPVIKEALWK